MSKSRCPIEEDNLKKRKEECPLKNVCSSSYKKICQNHNKVIKDMEMVI